VKVELNVAKIFQHEVFDAITPVMDPLIVDSDKFKQRAGGEFLVGLLRGNRYHSYCFLSSCIDHALGAKHWPKTPSDRLWAWTTSRLDRIFAQIKPDTLSFWETAFSVRKSPSAELNYIHFGLSTL
jgi:proteasome activator subunit 4